MSDCIDKYYIYIYIYILHTFYLKKKIKINCKWTMTEAKICENDTLIKLNVFYKGHDNLYIYEPVYFFKWKYLKVCIKHISWGSRVL